MTPPIDNLDYREGPQFTARVRHDPGIAERIHRFFNRFPNAGEVICGNLKMVEVEGYTVVVVRDVKRHKLGLLNVFQLPEEAPQFEAYIEEVRRVYCSGGRHG